MTVSLSEDEGNSWKYSLLLDSGETSYPDAVESSDGAIYIVYDHGRCSFKEIICARITEEDIIAGRLVNTDSYLKQIISKAPAVPDLPDGELARVKSENESWCNKIFSAKF